jgi:hypothetical protein
MSPKKGKKKDTQVDSTTYKIIVVGGLLLFSQFQNSIAGIPKKYYDFTLFVRWWCWQECADHSIYSGTRLSIIIYLLEI